MSNFRIEKGTLALTETTVRELLVAIDAAKENKVFTDKPREYCDMDVEDRIEEDWERGEILVESEYSGISFSIILEKKPNTQESLGYKLHKAPPVTGRVLDCTR